MGFGWFEGELKYALDAGVSADAYLLFRLPVTTLVFFAFIFIFLSNFRHRTAPLLFNPRKIDYIILFRGFLTAAYLSLLAYAFRRSPSQSITYAFFFLHPVAQVITAALYGGRLPRLEKHRVIAFFGVFATAFVLAFYKPSDDGSIGKLVFNWNDFLEFHFPAFLAGVFFGITNHQNCLIKDNCTTRPYRIFGRLPVEGKPSFAHAAYISAYTTYASLLSLPFSVSALMVFLSLQHEKNVWAMTFDDAKLFGSQVTTLTFACLIVVFATLIFTFAFTLASKKASPSVAVTDAFVLPTGIVMDIFWRKSLSFDDPNTHRLLGLMVVMLIFVGLSLYETADNDKPSSGLSTGEGS